MIHQPSGGFEGVATDAEINLREMMHHKKTLNEVISKHTGQPVEKVAQDVERDYWLGAEEAKEYGMIDHILNKELR
jgi:ATP-dependent Clp protease protease subunit